MPDVVRRRIRAPESHFDGTATDYLVYERWEADEAGIDYVPWYDCREPLEWGLTDDDYVMQFIRTEDGKKGRNGRGYKSFFTAGVVAYGYSHEQPRRLGLGPSGPGSMFLYGPYRKVGGRYYKLNPGMSFNDALATRYRTKIVMRLYAILYIESERLEVSREDQERLALKLCPDARTIASAYKRWREFLRSDPGQEMKDKSLQQALRDRAIGWDELIDDYKKVLSHALDEKTMNLKEATAVIDRLVTLKREATPNEFQPAEEGYDSRALEEAEQLLGELPEPIARTEDESMALAKRGMDEDEDIEDATVLDED